MSAAPTRVYIPTNPLPEGERDMFTGNPASVDPLRTEAPTTPFWATGRSIRDDVNRLLNTGAEPNPAPPRPNYYIEPDLTQTQMGETNLPPGAVLGDDGVARYPDDNSLLTRVRRPGVIPLAFTPQGPELVMPRLLDAAGNIMGGVAGVETGGKVLGSGLVRQKNADGVRRIPMSDYNHDMETAGVLFDQAKEWRKTKAKPEVAVLDPKELRTTQNTFEEGVGHDGGFKGLNDKPFVARTPDGQLHILDGHHRMEAAAAKGGKLPAYVIDVPGDPQVAAYSKRNKVLRSGLGDERTGVAGAAVQADKAPPWYSAVENALEQTTTGSAPGAQWLATLRNSRGVKPEEMSWLGLDDYLAAAQLEGRKVTRAELQDYVKSHAVELRDVTKSNDLAEKPSFGELTRRQGHQLEEAYLNYEGRTASDAQQLRAWYEKLNEGDLKSMDMGHFMEGPSQTKYHGYQLPGGENYREHLITMPEKQLTAVDLADRRGYKWDELTGKDIRQLEDEARKESINSKYRSSHWDEPNILAHVRTNDRVMSGTPVTEIEAKIAAAMPETGLQHMGSGMPTRAVKQGIITPEEAADWARSRNWQSSEFFDKPGTGKRSLHLEEVQSDWHQAGRKRGYKGDPVDVATPEKKLSEFQTEMEKKYGNAQGGDWNRHMTDGEQLQHRELFAAYQKAVDERNDARKGVPDAPFKKTWHELALKRMIRRAAEEGYDRLSWTPGEHHNRRYPGRPDKEQQGMEYFYDQMIPKALEKIGREHGVKVQKADLNSGKGAQRDPLTVLEQVQLEPDFSTTNLTRQINRLRETVKKGKSLEQALETNAEFISPFLHERLKKDVALPSQPIFYIDIPPSLRDVATRKGFPLFSRNNMFVPHTPEESDK